MLNHGDTTFRDNKRKKEDDNEASRHTKQRSGSHPNNSPGKISATHSGSEETEATKHSDPHAEVPCQGPQAARFCWKN